jgi:Nif-specific regulatory protein
MRARLTVEKGLADPAELDLESGKPIRLGRSRQNNQLVLHDEHASRQHAEILWEDGHWIYRPLRTTNTTYVSGRAITNPTVLDDGDRIQIGKVCLRFTLERKSRSSSPTSAGPNAVSPRPPERERGDEPSSDLTTLEVDELTSLFYFMRDAVGETTQHGLVTLALEVLSRQLQATLTGYLGLDPEDPLPRLLCPPEAEMDAPLSRRLTQMVLERRRSVWRARTTNEDLDNGSLAGYQDALCVPLHDARATLPDSDSCPTATGSNGTRHRDELALGALHVYRTGRPFTHREVCFSEVLASCLASHLRLLRSWRALEADNSRLRERAPSGGEELIGASPAMEQLRAHIRRLASGPGTVLITGESGSGKELVAIGLHRNSPRRDGPLIEVNCANIDRGRAESELFGHEKGAFTDAHAKRLGYFQLADEGTLFLDEIGELPMDCQAKLLRALETRKFWPLGASKPVSVDVRVIAATNRDLQQLVREGRFREDLFYRMVSIIQVPPLREHRDDVPALARHFLSRFNSQYHRSVVLTEAALEHLQGFSWPGNVRQLRCALETAVAENQTGCLLPCDFRVLPDRCLKEQAGEEEEILNLEALEVRAIRKALERTNGNNTHAARLLGIHRDTLINKLKKYGIERRFQIDPEET